MFKRLLVPLDGSPLAVTALAPAIALAKQFEGELLLVRTAMARTFPGKDPGPAQMKAIEEAKAYLETIANRLRKEGIQILTSTPYDSPAAGIVDQAIFHQVDLIVMVVPGHKGLEALLHPWIAMRVFTHTNASMLVWSGSKADIV